MAEYIYEIIKDSDGVDCYIKRGEIVRCKDCMYYHDGEWYCEAWNNSPGFPAVKGDGYCFMSEREGGTE